MRTSTHLRKDLFLILSHCNKLNRSPIKPERAECFWEDKGVTYIYNSEGQLFAIRQANHFIRRGSNEITIASILLDNGFINKPFLDGIILNPAITQTTCT